MRTFGRSYSIVSVTCLSLLWLAFFNLPSSCLSSLPFGSLKTADAADLPESQQGQEEASKALQLRVRTIWADPQLRNYRGMIPDRERMDLIKNLAEEVVSRNGTLGLQWKYQSKYTFSETLKPEITFVSMGLPMHYQNSSRHFPGTNIFDEPIYGKDKDIFQQPDRQLFIFNMKQQSDGLSFGANYRNIGATLKDLNDFNKLANTNVKVSPGQQVAELWVAKNFGPVKLKTFFVRFWDNKLYDREKDLDRSRMATTQGGISLDSKIPLVPIFMGTSYSQGYSESIFEPRLKKLKNTYNQTFSGYLYCPPSKFFDMTLSSSYSPIQDRINPDFKTEVYWHEIIANLRPAWYLTITPAFAVGDYSWPGNRTKTQLASLSLYTYLSKTVGLWFWGSQSKSKSTDGTQDYNTTYYHVGVTFKPQNLSRWNTNFSLRAGLDKYEDKIYPESSYTGFSGLLTLNTLF